MNKDDKFFLLGSIVIPLGLWWIFYGRDKYSTKGQR